MTLLELQQVLGERIKLAQDETLSSRQRTDASATTNEIIRLAKQMINNAAVILRADVFKSEYNSGLSATIDNIIGCDMSVIDEDTENAEESI